MDDAIFSCCFLGIGISFIALFIFWWLDREARNQRAEIYLTLDDDNIQIPDISIPIQSSDENPATLNLSQDYLEIKYKSGYVEKHSLEYKHLKKIYCNDNDSESAYLFIHIEYQYSDKVKMIGVHNEHDRKFIVKYIETLNRRIHSLQDEEKQKEIMAKRQQELHEENERFHEEAERRQQYEVYKQKVTLEVSELMSNNEFVLMAENLIDSQDLNIFTSTSYLIAWEGFLLQNNDAVGEAVLLSTSSQRNSSQYRTNFSNPFFLFHTLLQEKHSDIDEYTTYKFIYSVAVQHYADKWSKEHYREFEHIEKMSLDAAIEKYCLLDTIDIVNEVFLSTFTYYLISNNKFLDHSQNYILCREIVDAKVGDFIKRQKINEFANRLKQPKKSSRITMHDVDLMDGLEFERFIGNLFTQMGYSIEVTQSTRDQGIDVIVTKNGVKIGIQAKCYSSTVGNSAIQQVVAGKNHYRLDKAMVITNNFFTDSAKELAISNSVVLWDRSNLKAKLEEFE